MKSISQSSALQSAIQKRPILFFFFFAYAFSWILTIPFILAEWGILEGDFTILFVLKSFGPFFSALYITRTLYGKDGIKQLRQKIRQWKISWVWYLLVLIGIPALILLGVAVQPGKTNGFLGLNMEVLISYPIYFVVVFFGGGPLGEEPGWRGFALPRLQTKFGPMIGTLILGFFWTCWHLPDFLTSAQGGGPGTGWKNFAINFPIFLCLVTFLAILLTWIYNRCDGSIFMVLLAHASVNTPQVVLMPLFPAVDTTALNTAALIGFGGAALFIVILTRGKLGYICQSNTP
jgi:uncharacterized protein